MNTRDLKARTRAFAVGILKLIDKFPQSTAGRIVAGQLGRSGTSTGANYRSACRGRSKKDFISRIGVAEEEADESAYWIEVAVDYGLIKEGEDHGLLQEARELTAIFSSSGQTAKENLRRETSEARKKR